jgi:hypothetical protein
MREAIKLAGRLKAAKAFTDGSIADLNTVVGTRRYQRIDGTRQTGKLFLQADPRSDKVRALDRGDVRRAFPFFP